MSILIDDVRTYLQANSITEDIYLDKIMFNPDGSDPLEESIFIQTESQQLKPSVIPNYVVDFAVYIRKRGVENAQTTAYSVFRLLDSARSIVSGSTTPVNRIEASPPQFFANYDNNLTEYIIRCRAYVVDTLATKRS